MFFGMWLFLNGELAVGRRGVSLVDVCFPLFRIPLPTKGSRLVTFSLSATGAPYSPSYGACFPPIPITESTARQLYSTDIYSELPLRRRRVLSSTEEVAQWPAMTLVQFVAHVIYDADGDERRFNCQRWCWPDNSAGRSCGLDVPVIPSPEG